MINIIMGTDSLQCELAASFYLNKEVNDQLNTNKKPGKLYYVGEDKDGNSVYCLWSKKDIKLVPRIVNSLNTMYSMEKEYKFLEVSCSKKLTIKIYTYIKSILASFKLTNLEQQVEDIKINMLKINIKVNQITTT